MDIEVFSGISRCLAESAFVVKELCQMRSQLSKRRNKKFGGPSLAPKSRYPLFFGLGYNFFEARRFLQSVSINVDHVGAFRIMLRLRSHRCTIEWDLAHPWGAETPLESTPYSHQSGGRQGLH